MRPDQKTIAGAALALGISVGILGGLAVNNADEAPPVDPIAADDVLLESAELHRQMTESQAEGVVSCKRGVIDNLPPNRVYCFDGKTAGFLLSEIVAYEVMSGDASEARIYMHDGFVYRIAQ